MADCGAQARFTIGSAARDGVTDGLDHVGGRGAGQTERRVEAIGLQRCFGALQEKAGQYVDDIDFDVGFGDEPSTQLGNGNQQVGQAHAFEIRCFEHAHTGKEWR